MFRLLALLVILAGPIASEAQDQGRALPGAPASPTVALELQVALTVAIERFQAMDRAAVLSNISGQSSLSEREREISVLVITSRWRSVYPTAAYEKRGVEVGLRAATVEAIVAGLPVSFSDTREQVVYEVAMALAPGRLVPRALRSRRQGARARERDRHDRPHGLLHGGLADDELLRRAARKPRARALGGASPAPHGRTGSRPCAPSASRSRRAWYPLPGG